MMLEPKPVATWSLPALLWLAGGIGLTTGIVNADWAVMLAGAGVGLLGLPARAARPNLRLAATPEGLVLPNWFRPHRFAWNQIGSLEIYRKKSGLATSIAGRAEARALFTNLTYFQNDDVEEFVDEVRRHYPRLEQD